MQRIPRLLDDAEVRVLGALLEKEQTTPELYPLSVNALVQACNQRTARDPVMEVTDAGVHWALRQLFNDGLVNRTDGARVTRWRHNVDQRWDLDGGRKAVIALLLLRGAQTPWELRSRSERLHPFATIAEIEDALASLSSAPEPLVVELARTPGQKEARFAHLLQGAPANAPPAGGVSAYLEVDRSSADLDFGPRLAAIEARLRDLEETVSAFAASAHEPLERPPGRSTE